MSQFLSPSLGALLAPLAALPPSAGLVLLSFIMTVGMLLLVRALSDQVRVAESKRQIHAVLLEIRLFKADLRAVGRAGLELIWRNSVYFRVLIVPATVVAIPLTVFLTQLDTLYGSTGWAAGESTLVTVRLRENSTPLGTTSNEVQAQLIVPASVRVESVAIWFPVSREIVWKVTPLAKGKHHLEIRLGHETFSKTLHASEDVARLAPSRSASNVLKAIFEASDALLPRDASVTSIAINYPARQVTFLGWRLHWLVALAGLILAFALVLRRPLGVVL